MASTRLDKDAILVPIGTTNERPTPEQGLLRFNTDEGSFEGYNGEDWGQIGGGAIDDLFYENARDITENYTVSATRNTMTIGPVVIDSGVTITVPSDGRWVIV